MYSINKVNKGEYHSIYLAEEFTCTQEQVFSGLLAGLMFTSSGGRLFTSRLVCKSQQVINHKNLALPLVIITGQMGRFRRLRRCVIA